MVYIDKEPVELYGKKEFYLLGDTHYPRGSRSKFLKVISEVKNNRNARIIGFGDYIEGITTSNKHYHPEETAHIIKKSDKDLNMIDEQWAMFEEDISPVADKILGLHAGNHEHVLIVRGNSNGLSGICRRLDIPYLGEGFALHEFKGGSGVAKMATFHGVGGGVSAGAAYNKLAQFSHIFGDLDVIAAAHTHKLGVNVQIAPLELNHGELKQKYQYSCSTGSFLTNYNSDICSYGERKGYHPLPLGYVKVFYDDGVIKTAAVCPV